MREGKISEGKCSSEESTADVNAADGRLIVRIVGVQERIVVGISCYRTTNIKLDQGAGKMILRSLWGTER